MDGKDLKRRVRQLLNEDSDSGWLDERTTFDFLYEAACEFVVRTHCLRSTQSITTVASQTDYNLNPDFLQIGVSDNNNEDVIKWGSNTFINRDNYGDILYYNNTSDTSVPSAFAIADAGSISVITGTATSAGAATGGESTLTDTAGDFSDAYHGDVVHNTTDGSSGIVTSKTSSTVLSTALFGGTNNDWSSSDSYVIQPSGRFKLVLDPPPDSAETVTVYYLKKPEPVYSDYQVYRFPNHFTEAIVKYAAWLYKYRDSKPGFGDALFKFWERKVKMYGTSLNQTLGRKANISWKA